MKDVSIILVSYNTKTLLQNCLASVYEHTTGVSFETIVVDNASIDGSVEMVENLFPEVLLVKNKSNVGFGIANNYGAEKALSKYLFFLNTDTILLNNAVKVFFNFMEQPENNSVAAVGGELLNTAGTIIHSYGNFPTLLSTLSLTFRYNLYYKIGLIKIRNLIRKDKSHPTPAESPFIVDYITGADLFIRKDVFFIVGAFNPAFFMYCEESDLQKRISEIGLKRLILPGTKIIHLEGGSSNNKRTKKNDYFYESMHTYFRLHKPRLAYLAFKFFFALLPKIPM